MHDMRFFFLNLFFISACCFNLASKSFALETNTFWVENPPQWLKPALLNTTTDKIEKVLEWDIRKVRLVFYSDAAAFKKENSFDDTVLALFKRVGQEPGRILISPKIQNSEQLAPVLGHELVHVILSQKFKQSIPKWLEEGLANYLSTKYVGKRGQIDYELLRSKPLAEVRVLEHPFRSSPFGPKYHYMASTALIEMIASKCDLIDLLQLAVGSNFETYLSTYCQIKDLNISFREWVGKKR